MSFQDQSNRNSLLNQQYFRIAELATTAERRARTYPGYNGRTRNLKARPAKKGLLPLGESTIWEMVRRGEFPQPIRISNRITVWRSSDIIEWMEEKNLV